MSDEGVRPRFVVDVMLGRLARWLRLLGYDTVYSSEFDDAELARLARSEARILLTRDRELTRRRALRTILIEDDNVDAQLRQVISSLNLSLERAFTVCIHCNAPLVVSNAAQAREHVPPFVFASQSRFSRCPTCGRFYWRGTHWARIKAILDDAQNPAGPAD